MSVSLRDTKEFFSPSDFPKTNPDSSKFVQSFLTVDPNKKTFSIAFRTVGHSLSARLDKPIAFDPTLRGTFDASIVITFDTNGPIDDPVVPRFARIHMENFRTEITDISLGDAMKRFSNATIADSGASTVGASDTNKAIRFHANGHKFAGVVPGERRVNGAEDFVFQLQEGPPITPRPLGRRSEIPSGASLSKQRVGRQI